MCYTIGGETRLGQNSEEATVADEPVEVTMEDGAEPDTPLADVARIMAALIDSAEDVSASAQGTRIVAVSAGVRVVLNVLSVSADAEEVLYPE